MKVDTRNLSRTLRCLPKSEVEKYCFGCGMSDREMNALIDYLYLGIKQSVLSDRLGMSRSTFIRREKKLAVKLLRYMVSIGAVEEIVSNRSSVDFLVPELELFGK